MDNDDSHWLGSSEPRSKAAPIPGVPTLSQGLPLFMVLSFYPTMTWDWATPF